MTDEKGYMGNPKLRRERTTRNYTPEELAELLKCSQDIEYFAEHYATIITLDAGEQIIDLYDYQRELLNTMHKGEPENDKYNTIILSPRQSGKCVTGDCKIKIRDKKFKKVKEIEIEKLFDLMSLK
jgi:hypothetical protein